MSVSTLRLNGEFTFQLLSLLAPHTPVNWMKKRSKVMGNLSTFQSLLVQCLEVYLEGPEASSDATGLALVSTLSALFTNLALPNTIREALTSLIQPLTLLCKQASSEPPIFPQHLLGKVDSLSDRQFIIFSLFCNLSTNTLPFPFVPSVGEALQWCSRLPADPLCFGVRWWTPGSAFSSALCVVSSQEQTAPQLSHPVLELHLCQLNQPHLPWWDQVKISRSFNLADIFWARTLLQLWFQGEMDKMLFTFSCQFFSPCGG